MVIVCVVQLEFVGRAIAGEITNAQGKQGRAEKKKYEKFDDYGKSKVNTVISTARIYLLRNIVSSVRHRYLQNLK